MEWSEEDIFVLIEAYRLFPLLWNPGDECYYQGYRKADAWKDISNSVGRPEDACKKKMLSLLASYRREKLKEKNSTEPGKATSEVYHSRWFAFEAFQFLEDRDKPRPRMEKETVIAEKDAESSIAEDEAGRRPEENKEFVAPKTVKRAKKDDDRKLLENAVEILKTTAGRIKTSAECNEIKTFTAFLSTKMMAYSPTTRTGVQHSIYEIIMMADKGLFENPTDERLNSAGPSRTAPQRLPQHLQTSQSSKVENPLNILKQLRSRSSAVSPKINSQNRSTHSPSSPSSLQDSDDLNDYV